MSKKKLVKSVGAAAIASAIAVGATFAWQGQTQIARNEAQGDINPGGRLHDDYFIGSGGEDLLSSGATKRVYVENFTTEPLFVRVKLREFMETGDGAGTGTGTKVTVTGETEPNFGDPKTWHTYQLGESTPFRTYWTWNLSKSADGAVSYLPTFNRNKDSVVPDVNGSWKGEFADYIDWNTLDTSTILPDYLEYVAAVAPAGAGVKGWEVYDNDDDTVDEPNNNGYQVGIDTRERDEYVYGSKFVNTTSGELDFSGYADAVTAYETAYNDWVTNGNPTTGTYYDDAMAKLDALKAYWNFNGPAPDNDADVDIAVGTQYTDGEFPAVPEKAFHEVRTTLSAERDVMTLSAWLALKPAEQIGDYWVYDDSAAPADGGGWFYWANPLTARSATAPLLTGYEPNNTPENSWYYAIDVDMECGTKGAWAETDNVFDAGGMSAKGEYLLDVVSGRVDPYTGGWIVKSLGNDVDIIQLGSFMRGTDTLDVSTKPYSADYNSSSHHAVAIADPRVGTGNLETLPGGDYTGPEYSFGSTPMSADSVDTGKALQWVRIKDTEKGVYMYICDRSLLANISWEMVANTTPRTGPAGTPLGTKNYVTGASTEFTYPGTDIKHTVSLRLLTGGSAGKAGTDTANDWDGTNSTDAEWDRYICNDGSFAGLVGPNADSRDSSLEKKVADFSSDSNQLWHWAGAWSWCQDTTISGAKRTARGSLSARAWSFNIPAGYNEGSCFRPCFEMPL